MKFAPQKGPNERTFLSARVFPQRARELPKILLVKYDASSKLGCPRSENQGL